jgi:hypothetical protein
MTTRDSHRGGAGWQSTACARAGLATVAGSSSPGCVFILDLAVSAALDVAIPADEITLAAHVAVCRHCAVDLAELRNVAACLGAAVPQVEPPATLRRRMIDATLRGTAAHPAIARNEANPSNGAAHADH